jgi:hypothetical protein
VTKENPPQTDFDALAKKYLDLWQDQIAKMARDPVNLGDAAAAWSQMAASLMQGAAGVPNPMNAAAHAPATNASSPLPAAQRPTPAASPPGDGGVDFAELFRRLDSIERRLAALEGQPPAKPGRKRSGATGGRRSDGDKS